MDVSDDIDPIWSINDINPVQLKTFKAAFGEIDYQQKGFITRDEFRGYIAADT